VDDDVDGAEGFGDFLERGSDTGLRDDIGRESEDLSRRIDGLDGLGGFFQKGSVAADECDGFGACCGPRSCYFLCGMLVCDNGNSERVIRTPPIPPVAPVITIVFPAALSSGFWGSMAL
jgi:hypothetical protein